MPLDPQVEEVLAENARLNLPPLDSLSPAAARQQMLDGAPPVDPARSAARVADHQAPGPAGPIPVRLYYPEGSGPLPLAVYFHGGGWVIGNIDTHDAICHALAAASGCAIASVEYRLAPEHRFPAAVDDAYAATCWVARHGAALGADVSRVAVAGDSAGGNLAAVVALLARSRGGPPLALQALIYPITDCDLDTPSYRENAAGYLLTRDVMAWFWNHYVPDAAERRNPQASPLHAGKLTGLPPAVVITAEYDPLRDEGQAYARRLQAAGVPVDLLHYPGLVHGFFRMTARLDSARDALERVAATLRAALGETGRRGTV